MNNTTEFKYINIDYFFNQAFEFFKKFYLKFSEIFNWIKEVNFKFYSVIVSLVFLTAIIIITYKILKLRKRQIVSLAKFLTVEELSAERDIRWKEIKKRLDSENPSDWKMAIISADSLMDEILENIGYEGKTMNERLKIIEPSDFDNLKNVWEAHRVRNKIAHEWESFELTKEEAKSVIEKYEQALKELRYL